MLLMMYFVMSLLENCWLKFTFFLGFCFAWFLWSANKTFVYLYGFSFLSCSIVIIRFFISIFYQLNFLILCFCSASSFGSMQLIFVPGLPLSSSRLFYVLYTSYCKNEYCIHSVVKRLSLSTNRIQWKKKNYWKFWESW